MKTHLNTSDTRTHKERYTYKGYIFNVSMETPSSNDLGNERSSKDLHNNNWLNQGL